MDTTSLDLDDKEREDGDKTLSRPHFGCEEIRRCERGPMAAQELRPCGLSSTLGRGLNSMILKDAFDGVVHDDVAETLVRPLNTSLAPARIVLCHLDDEILDLLHDAMASFAGFVRPFLRDQFAMPGQQCVGRDNGRVLTEQTTT